MKTKYILILGFVFITLNAFSQVVVSDTITSDTLRKNQFFSKMLFDANKKHTHIIDIEIMPMPTIGYNYFYRLNPIFQIGTRFGFTTFKVLHGIHYNDRIYPLKLEALSTIKLYRSIRAELGTGYEVYYNSGIANGSSECTNCKQDQGDITFRFGINLSLFKHLFIRGGLVLSYDLEYKDYYNQFFGSIGYKF